MQIYKTSETGVTIKYSDTVVGCNQPEKIKKTLEADTLINVFSVPVKGWTGTYAPSSENQKIFTGAGEYERNGVFLRGFSTATEIDKHTVQGTLWYITKDDIRSCILPLAVVPEKKYIEETATQLGKVDVVILVCTKEGLTRIKPIDVASFIARVGAQAIILFGDDESTIKTIGKELGSMETKVENHTVKKKDVSGDTLQVIHLT